MSLVKKTKQEREDTPLAKSPEAIAPITDVKSAIADIEKRSSERQAAIREAGIKSSASRAERSKKRTGQTGGGRLQGLASLTNTLGTQYVKKDNN
jgi:hypothetical protein